MTAGPPPHDPPAGPPVAFLGPVGTFTWQAARRAVPEGRYVACATIAEVVAAVRDRQVRLGVVPIENSVEGAVNLTLDELAFGPEGARIRGEVTVPITIHLLARRGTALADVKVVRSHPHAIAQCRRWLARHLPDVALEAATSTAEAARQVAAEDGAAALAPDVGDRFDLDALATDVGDHSENTTRFVVLGTEMARPTGADKTSIVVVFAEDRPGLLLRVLDELALRGINLTKIESRPTKQALGRYAILLDCAAHVSEARMAEALRSIHRHSGQVRVLGSYPRADGVPSPPAEADSDAAYGQARSWYESLLQEVEHP